MCWTGPFEFRWLKGYIHNPSYYHHQIGSIHLSHCCHICPWLCYMVVLSYSVIFYIYIPGKLGHCFHYWCSVYCICKWADTLWPVDRVRLFADYTISLSSLCRLIWRHWTTKMLVRYMLPSVWLRLRQFSQSSFIFDLWGCVSSLNMRQNISESMWSTVFLATARTLLALFIAMFIWISNLRLSSI